MHYATERVKLLANSGVVEYACIFDCKDCISNNKAASGVDDEREYHNNYGLTDAERKGQNYKLFVCEHFIYKKY